MTPSYVYMATDGTFWIDAGKRLDGDGWWTKDITKAYVRDFYIPTEDLDGKNGRWIDPRGVHRETPMVSPSFSLEELEEASKIIAELSA